LSTAFSVFLAIYNNPDQISYLLDMTDWVWYWPMMNDVQTRQTFTPEQVQILNQAVTMAEELVSNYFKMSASQWLHPKYDVKTLADLLSAEIVNGPFAQIIRYEGQRKGSTLGSEVYDYYKICLQDHAILNALHNTPDLALLPFCLYIVTHELVHIVRFSKFLQNFDASPNEKLAEEHRVHELTHLILSTVRLTGIERAIDYYHRWHAPLEKLCEQ
jgi:hypothetical protein